ncbi:MAG: hypothetical protein MPJ05_06495 [Nitrosopumilus sp.]|nr:hypothetical protein [Nitrosopumilus sp.]
MVGQQAAYRAIIGRGHGVYYGIISTLPSCFVDGVDVNEVVRNLENVARMSRRTLQKYGSGSHVPADQVDNNGIGILFDRQYFHDNGMEIVGTRTITI